MVIIDPSKGGTDIGVIGNDLVEKDFNLKISEYIYDRLNELGIDTKIIRTSDENISIEDRISRILNSYGNNSKVIVLSNMLGKGSNGVEIIYALRNKDTLAKAINDNLESSDINVSKYYQRRSEEDTSKDYYDIQKDTGTIETIIINYGNVDNVLEANNLKNNYKSYAEAIIKAIANYKGIKYFKEGENENIYIVQKGDSLYSISKKYNTTVDEIKRLNNLSTNNLSIGQILRIPSIKVNINEETYVVQKGDNLYGIARNFGVTVDEIKRLNNLTSNIIDVGQVLKIKSSMSSDIYIVQKGDSLYSISKKYNTTVDEIKRLNNLSTNNLSIGQKLKIPTTPYSANNIYIVQKGDNLYSIALKYNTTVDNIKKLNNLSSNLLNIGQQLKVN